MKLFSFDKIHLKLLDHIQMFLIYPNFANFTQLEWSFFWLVQFWRLLELPNDSSSLKSCVYFAIRGKKEW